MTIVQLVPALSIGVLCKYPDFKLCITKKMKKKKEKEKEKEKEKKKE